jgi:hypothetical protein
VPHSIFATRLLLFKIRGQQIKIEKKKLGKYVALKNGGANNFF